MFGSKENCSGNRTIGHVQYVRACVLWHEYNEHEMSWTSNCHVS